jgi:hypothetical protein
MKRASKKSRLRKLRAAVTLSLREGSLRHCGERWAAPRTRTGALQGAA